MQAHSCTKDFSHIFLKFPGFLNIFEIILHISIFYAFLKLLLYYYCSLFWFLTYYCTKAKIVFTQHVTPLRTKAGFMTYKYLEIFLCHTGIVWSSQNRVSSRGGQMGRPARNDPNTKKPDPFNFVLTRHEIHFDPCCASPRAEAMTHDIAQNWFSMPDRPAGPFNPTDTGGVVARSKAWTVTKSERDRRPPAVEDEDGRWHATSRARSCDHGWGRASGGRGRGWARPWARASRWGW